MTSLKQPAPQPTQGSQRVPTSDRRTSTQLLAPIPTAAPWAFTQRVVSAALLVALTPVFAVLWVAVRATSSGPFLSKTRREGFLGIPFDVWKIRSERINEPYANKRLTPVGSVLRRLKLDVLPQLYNVVRGDMAWVGPRPLPLHVADNLQETIEAYDERLRVMPGLTNLGVIASDYDATREEGRPNFEKLVRAELSTLERRSVLQDMGTLALTGPYIARRAFSSLFLRSYGSKSDDQSTSEAVARDVQEWLDSAETHIEPRESALIWRFGQRTAAATGLVLLSPLFAAMYVAVKVSSPGPFLFSQMRRGYLGKAFRIYKVRTMSLGSEKKTALGVQNTDPAVTKVGRIMRALKLDEFPQLWNVVRGDMELVGPRPIPLALEDELRKHIPNFRMRHLVRPGLTNVGQVSVMDNELNDRLIADWKLRAEGERHYVAHKSVSYDIVLVVMTALYMARKALKRSPSEAETGTTATMVLGTPIANLDYQGVIAKFDEWLSQDDPSRYVCICPVHSVIEARMHESHRKHVVEADLNTADGMPIVWAQRVLGHKNATRVYGPTLMLETMARAEKEGWRVALFGGHPERLALLESRLHEQFPDLQLVFTESPPFRALTEEEDEDLCKRMNEAQADIVWVGLGCPKQERWMHEHRGRIRGIFVGVGAAFDFHAGMLRQAPAWMQGAGLEWLFRLYCEPKRLFKRYATTNPMFLALFGLQVLQRVVLRRRFTVPVRSDEPTQ